MGLEAVEAWIPDVSTIAEGNSADGRGKQKGEGKRVREALTQGSCPFILLEQLSTLQLHFIWEGLQLKTLTLLHY